MLQRLRGICIALIIAICSLIVVQHASAQNDAPTATATAEKTIQTYYDALLAKDRDTASSLSSIDTSTSLAAQYHAYTSLMMRFTPFVSPHSTTSCINNTCSVQTLTQRYSTGKYSAVHNTELTDTIITIEDNKIIELQTQNLPQTARDVLYEDGNIELVRYSFEKRNQRGRAIIWYSFDVIEKNGHIVSYIEFEVDPNQPIQILQNEHTLFVRQDKRIVEYDLQTGKTTHFIRDQ